MLIRLLDRVFQDLKSDFVYHYLDDIIYSESFESHLGHIRQVLDSLKTAVLTVKQKMIVFATHEITFLRYLVSPAGVRIDPERTCAIREFPTTRDNKGFSRFISMVNFYHTFLLRLADVAAPLNALRKKGAKFVWRWEQQEAFDALKQAISQPPVLRMADLF